MLPIQENCADERCQNPASRREHIGLRCRTITDQASSPICSAPKKGPITMSESVAALYDEETLSFEVPDIALERAGSKWGDGAAAAVTAAFCSGLDSCPSSPRT